MVYIYKIYKCSCGQQHNQAGRWLDTHDVQGQAKTLQHTFILTGKIRDSNEQVEDLKTGSHGNKLVRR